MSDPDPSRPHPNTVRCCAGGENPVLKISRRKDDFEPEEHMEFNGILLCFHTNLGALKSGADLRGVLSTLREGIW